MWCSEKFQILQQAQQAVEVVDVDWELFHSERDWDPRGENSKPITLAPMTSRHSDAVKCPRREDVGMVCWNSCSGLRVLEDDKIPQEALRSAGINRHEWERSPLGAHAALFMHRALEIGRLSAFAKKYHDRDDRNAFQQQMSENPRVGWMRDIPDENHPRTCREARLRRWVPQGQDWAEDVWTFRRRNRWSYTKVLEPYIRSTPALRDAFAMKWWHNHTATSNASNEGWRTSWHFQQHQILTEVLPMCFLQKDLKRLMRVLVQDHCFFWSWTTSLTKYEESRKPGWRPLQASCSWVVRRNAWRPQLHQHNRKTKR